MQAFDVLQILVQATLVWLLTLAFVAIGNGLFRLAGIRSNKSFTTTYAGAGLNFIVGLVLVIAVYAIVVSRGVTINWLLLPLLYFFIRSYAVENNSSGIITTPNIPTLPYAELALVSLLSVIVLHLFPESEYKQADSFFYLKIVESLNATGQENISHYANAYSNIFHGAEPYHYFELWLTALLIKCTQSFLPSINVARYVCHGLLLSGLVVMLYAVAAAVLKRSLTIGDKLFCWSLLFIMPNLLGFFPQLYHVFISDFEGNVLDRPNFRTIYLFMAAIMLLLSVHKKFTASMLYLLLMLCVASFQCAVVFLPALVLYGFILLIKRDAWHKKLWMPVLLSSVGIGCFYFLASPDGIPSFLGQSQSSLFSQMVLHAKFILFSIATSVLYILLLMSLLLFPLFIMRRKAMLVALQQHAGLLLPFVCMAVTGVLLARIFYIKDNAYQFIFIAHIFATGGVWLAYLWYLSSAKKTIVPTMVAVWLSVLWVLHWWVLQPAHDNIFKRNGRFVYEGMQYSPAYTRQVLKYFSTNKQGAGAYIADSTFYNQLYYSRRNPNVYFMPITYIVAGKHNGNVEFCLSDTSAILHGLTDGVFTNYLSNAINRSLFYQYRLQNMGLTYPQQVKAFVASNKLSYIIVAKNVKADGFGLRAKQLIADPNTGEQFLILP